MQTVTSNVSFFNRRRIWQTLALFGVLGPMIGSLVVCLEIFLIAFPPMNSQNHSSVGEMLAVVAMVCASSYRVGFIPSLMTGLAAEVLRFRLGGLAGYLLMTVIGAIAAMAGSMLLTGSLQWAEVPKEMFFSGLPGAVAAAILYWLIRCKSTLIHSSAADVAVSPDVRPGATMQTVTSNVSFFNRRRIWRTLALFGVLGPTIGSLVVCLEIFLIAFPPMNSQNHSSVGEMLAVVAVVCVTSYRVGFIPSLMTGLAAEVLRFRLGGLAGYLLMTVIGAIAAMAGSMLLTGSLQWAEGPKEMFFSGLPGAVAAAILYWLIRRKSTLIHSSPADVAASPDVRPGATMQTVTSNVSFFNRRRIWRTLALFGVLGAPIGGLVFCLEIFLIAFPSMNSQNRGSVGEMLAFVAVVCVTSYRVGFIPALMTSLAAEVLRFRLGGLAGYLLMTVIGAIAAMAGWMSPTGSLQWAVGPKELTFWGLPGAVAAAVLYWLMRRQSTSLHSSPS